jgi:1-acyl-sn-glycerol-3-phosphate acyltransferase
LLIVIFDKTAYATSIKGRKNLKVDRAFIVSNHTLYMDPAVIAHVVFPRRSYYSALEETFEIPGIGTYIRLLGAFPLPQKNPLPRVMRALKKALATRGLVHFFPEGELFHRNQHIRDFKDGVFFLSVGMDIPIIPVTLILNRRRFFGRQLPEWLPKLTVIVSPPVYPAQFRTNGERREAVPAMKRYVHGLMSDTIAKGQRSAGQERR